jgi:hypothetical protein
MRLSLFKRSEDTMPIQPSSSLKESADKRQWGPNEIDDGQKRLASLAVRTWPIDNLD